MLNATRRLTTLYSNDESRFANCVQKTSYATIICRHGSPEDADALLPIFLRAPAYREELLSPLAAHGDNRTAEAIFASCINGGQLKPGMPSGVLACLGYLGFQEAERVLWNYASTAKDHSVHCDACVGLINLPCDDIVAEIDAAIRGCIGKPFFLEFLPSLAYKTGNPDLLAAIYEHGRTIASTDCNGGIIEGVALYGPPGRDLFTEILWNPQWEAACSSTGSNGRMYAGVRALGLKITDLFDDFRRRRRESFDRMKLEYNLVCIASLIESHLKHTFSWNKTFTDYGDSLVDLQRSVFQRSDSGEDDDFATVWRRFFGDVDGQGGSNLERRLEAEILLGLQIIECLQYKQGWTDYELSLKSRLATTESHR